MAIVLYGRHRMDLYRLGLWVTVRVSYKSAIQIPLLTECNKPGSPRQPVQHAVVSQAYVRSRVITMDVHRAR